MGLEEIRGSNANTAANWQNEFFGTRQSNTNMDGIKDYNQNPEYSRQFMAQTRRNDLDATSPESLARVRQNNLDGTPYTPFRYRTSQDGSLVDYNSGTPIGNVLDSTSPFKRPALAPMGNMSPNFTDQDVMNSGRGNIPLLTNISEGGARDRYGIIQNNKARFINMPSISDWRNG